jgi:SOS response regulatory protein OraA/RecX
VKIENRRKTEKMIAAQLRQRETILKAISKMILETNLKTDPNQAIIYVLRANFGFKV